MLVVKGSSFPERDARLTGTIDIWWIVADGGMPLLLPFLLKKNKVWQGCQVRLFAIARDEDGPESVRSELKAFVRDFRLDVEVHVKPIINEDLLRVVSSKTKPGNDGVATCRSISGFPACRSISASLFPTWRRHAVDPDSLVFQRVNSVQRVNSGILPMFSQPKLPFPEQPPCGSGQIAKPESMCFDASMPLTPGREGTPKQSPSCRSVPDEREVLPSVETPQPTHAAAPERHAAPSLEEEELAVAMGLNDIIRSESAKAELVVTNLPDMPPGESIRGYFELIEELTMGLPRCLLVRGTANEVITAFT
jgi:potassium/chloride transporter 4/5/6